MNMYSVFNPANATLLPGRLASIADSLLREPSCKNGQCETLKWEPSVDVLETANGYEVLADLPGVGSGDVKVIVRDGLLTIEGERKSTPPAEGSKLLINERPAGTFTRAFRLPKDASGDRITASFKDGALCISVPRREEVKPREIEVQVN